MRVYVVTLTAQSTFRAQIGTVLLSPCKQWNNVSLQMSTLYTHVVIGDCAVTQALRVVTAVTVSISYFLQHYAAYGTHWMSYLFVRLLFPAYKRPFAFCCNISYVYLIVVLHSSVCYLNCALFRSCVSFIVTTVRHACLQGDLLEPVKTHNVNATLRLPQYNTSVSA